MLRFLVVLLLALAVPVQGLAAVAASQCMAFGHHQDAGTGHDAGSHEHDVAGGDEHDANPSHCGPCAACCASASIAGPPGVTISPVPSNTTYAFSQLAPPGFEPDGLDRPPLAL